MLGKNRNDDGIGTENDAHIHSKGGSFWVGCRATYVRFNQISAVRDEMVRIVHIPAFLNADKVFARIQSSLGARARQELFHAHILLQSNRNQLKFQFQQI